MDDFKICNSDSIFLLLLLEIQIRQYLRKYTLLFFFFLLTVIADEFRILFKLLLILGHYKFPIYIYS